MRTEKVSTSSLWSKTRAEIPDISFMLLKGEKVVELQEANKDHRVQCYALIS